MPIVGALPVTLQNGTTAEATEVMADLNKIRDDVNSNAAENGANSSITSLTGLTTPLSVAQGGTAAITKPLARTSLEVPHEAVVTLTDGATPALDASLGNVFVLVTTTNPTIAVPTNPVSGQRIIIRVTASGGARTLALNTGAGGFAFGTTITALTQTASGLTDYIGAIYNVTAAKWQVVGYVKGFA